MEAERKERERILEWGKSANLPLSMMQRILMKNKAELAAAEQEYAEK